MKDVLIYQPFGGPAQVAMFIEGLEPKLREKLLRQIIPLPRMPPPPSCGSPTTSILLWSGTAASMRSGQRMALPSALFSRSSRREKSCCCMASQSGRDRKSIV